MFFCGIEINFGTGSFIFLLFKRRLVGSFCVQTGNPLERFFATRKIYTSWWTDLNLHHFTTASKLYLIGVLFLQRHDPPYDGDRLWAVPHRNFQYAYSRLGYPVPCSKILDCVFNNQPYSTECVNILLPNIQLETFFDTKAAKFHEKKHRASLESTKVDVTTP